MVYLILLILVLFCSASEWHHWHVHHLESLVPNATTGELGYDGLIGTSKIGPSCAKSVVYI